MEAMGKRVFVTLDEPKIEQPKSGVQADFSQKIIKPTTGVVNYIGDEVTKYKKGDRVFLGEFYPEKTVTVPDVGTYTIILEESIIAKL